MNTKKMFSKILSEIMLMSSIVSEYIMENKRMLIYLKN